MNNTAFICMVLFTALTASGASGIQNRPFDVLSGFIPILIGVIGFSVSAYFAYFY